MGNRVQRSMGVLLLAWLLPITPTTAAECTPWAAKMASVQGEIEVKRAKTSTWHPVNRNDTFCPGDSLRVGDHSRAAIVLANETLLRLDQNSAIKLTQFETKTPSILELIKGIGHFISREPRSLKIETATVNAAIEGTEFVVAVSANETSVTVFEGIVLTQNQHGEMRITDGETVMAKANAAPVKTLLAKPRDTVQWALYFPPIIETDKPNKLSRASRLLYVGRVKEAQALLLGMDSGEALALQTIIAIVNNEKDRAFNLATDAIQQAPQSAATLIALSYTWQAKRDLKQALASAQQAVKHEPGNAIAWARLAELQLSTGGLDEALASAQQAVQLNEKLSRTQSILGYAYLVRIDIDEAIDVFNKAIELDQVDPLPRLGLGLAKIRKSRLAEGRREIEIAASLDPNNAIIRSYLGKAYFEEKRGPLDAEQFAMAKQLDPNDPTPYFYDAIRKQTENNPVGALEDLNKSIELNDNRAVYRSSLQLDQDEAARSASLARIYSDLGFDQSARVEASNSLANDPANHSAHRFLSDNYASRPRHEIARASELLQSQMLQPVSLNPIHPQSSESNLNIFSGIGPFQTGFNEYAPLFTRETVKANISTGIGTNNLLMDEIVIAGMLDRIAYSFGQFSYNTDGFRNGADVNHDISDTFLHYKLTNSLDIQFEYKDRRTNKGDERQSIEPTFSANERRALNEETSRIGLHFTLTPNSDFLASYIKNERRPTLDQTISPTVTLLTDVIDKSNDYHLQYIFKGDNYNLLVGSGVSEVNSISNTKILFSGSTISNTTTRPEDKQETIYVYSNVDLYDNLTATFGVSHDDIESEKQNFNIDEFNTKLGLIWGVSSNLRIRAAAFESIKRILVTNQALEPTQIAGFNQLYDDLNLTESKSYGLALEYNYSDELYSGIELFKRQLDIPQSSGSSFRSQDELSYSVYIKWLLSHKWQVQTEYHYEKFTNDTIDLAELKTATIPISLHYYDPSGFYSILRFSNVEQDGNYTIPAAVEVTSDFNVTDLALGYKLPKQQGALSLQINNLFDKSFLYQDLAPFNADKFNSSSKYIPEQSFVVKITIPLG